MLKTNSVQTHVNFAGHRVERPVISVRGEAIAGVLKTNATLTHIDLRLGKIGSEGVKARCLQRVRVSLFFFPCTEAIGEALKINSTLTSIDLKDNHIGDAGGKARWASERSVLLEQRCFPT